MIDSDSTEYAGTPPGTCFAARSSEEFMVKAGGEKGSQAYYLYGENLFRRQRSPMGSAANRSRKRFWDEFLVHDHLHSPAVLLTLGGTIHERYEYDAYGNPTIYTGDGGDGNWFDGDETSGDSSALGNPYLFTGRRVDFLDSNDLVLQYSRNRYYDYYSGRWLTQDPLGYVDGISLYEGCLSNPLRYVDPLGLQGWGGVYSPWGGDGPIIITETKRKRTCCPECIPGARDFEIVRSETYPALTPPERMKRLQKSLKILDVVTFFRFERPYFDPTWPIAHSIQSIYVEGIIRGFGERTGYDMYIIVKERRCEKKKWCGLFRRTWKWVDQKEYQYKCETGTSTYEKDVGHGCHYFVDKEALRDGVKSCADYFADNFDHSATDAAKFLWTFNRCTSE